MSMRFMHPGLRRNFRTPVLPQFSQRDMPSPGHLQQPRAYLQRFEDLRDQVFSNRDRYLRQTQRDFQRIMRQVDRRRNRALRQGENIRDRTQRRGERLGNRILRGHR